ncbi:MAG: YhcN/YlaJ family sporulation lipoprotein [Tissierellaceae bacterium]
MKKSILIITIILSIIIQMGCTNRDEVKLEGKADDVNLLEVSGEDKEIINRSENIADSVVELFGIDDATAIIFNENVIIGIILSYDQELSQDTLDTIVNLVNKNEPSIENVYITSDAKLFKQIDNIVVEILQGKSYDKYVPNINKIMDKVKKEK